MSLSPAQQNALTFLRDNAEEFAKNAPPGKEDEWKKTWFFHPNEPSYSWPTHYGDFTPQTMRSLVKRGLVRTGEHAYQVNQFRLSLDGWRFTS